MELSKRSKVIWKDVKLRVIWVSRKGHQSDQAKVIWEAHMRSSERTYSAYLGENALGHLNALLKAFGGKKKVINV